MSESTDPLRVELAVPASGQLLPLVRRFLDDVIALAGFRDAAAERLAVAAEEACANVVDHAFAPDDEGRYAVVALVTAADLVLEVHDSGLPVDPNAADDEGLEVRRPRVSRPGGMRLIRDAADHVAWVPRGRAGKALRLVTRRPRPDVTAWLPPEALARWSADEPLAPEQEYVIRGFAAGDAVGIARCIYRAYGDTYLHDDCYVPERLVHLNASGALVSIVAEDATGEIVGHYALERFDGGRVAERGMAVVHPAHRGRDLMGRMRSLLEDEARRIGLAGVYSHAVMRHAYSQKVNESFGSDPCGVLLGAGPSEMRFKGIGTGEPVDRLSFVLYFSHVGTPAGAAALEVPERHREVVERIYRGLGTAVTFAPPAPIGVAPSVVDVRYSHTLDGGTIRVRRIGPTTAAEVRRSARDLASVVEAQVVHLHVPLAQPGAASLCEAAAEWGFFFGGIGPAFADDGDVLLLQWAARPVDPAALAVATPFVQELVEYIGRDRARVAAAP